MSAVKGIVGANVVFCGHNGYFVADIVLIGNVAVIQAGGPVVPDRLHRNNDLGPPTHHIVDFPKPVFWKPRLGVFVVPKGQVRVL